MLDKLYEFQDYKIVNNGAWVIEQYQDQEIKRTRGKLGLWAKPLGAGPFEKQQDQ